MKIVVVNAADSGGGAERIAANLVDGLRERGHRVSFLCGEARRPGSRAMMGKLDWVLGRSVKRIGYADAFSVAASRFLSYPEVRDADLIHFHNLHGFYFGVAQLPAIMAEKPCVWTLHDCWALSGGCYSHLECRKWAADCSRCPCHGRHPMTGFFDTASGMLRLKLAAFRALVSTGGVATGVSAWMAGRIGEFFAAHGVDAGAVHCLPNRVDLPLQPKQWPVLPVTPAKDRPVLLLVAADVNNTMKGMPTALGALQDSLDTPFQLLTVGAPLPDVVLARYGLAERTLQLGQIHDRAALAAVYAAATATLVPTLAESFCLVAAESIACGTPVIASDVTALPELVHPGVTGFLARVGDREEFSSRLRDVLSMSCEEYQQLRHSTRLFAGGHFPSLEEWVGGYEWLYSQVIARHQLKKGHSQ